MKLFICVCLIVFFSILLNRFFNPKKIPFSKIFNMLSPFLIICLVWFQLELSSHYSSVFSIFQTKINFILLNIVTIACVFLLFYGIFYRLWLAELFLEIIGIVIALVNYYTIQFHGMPFSTTELKNIKTALNVLDSYHIYVDKTVLLLLATFLMALIVIVLQKKISIILDRKSSINRLVYIAIASFFTVITVYMGYLAPNALKPKITVGWLWSEAYHQYGYTACSVEVFLTSKNCVQKPKDYSEKTVKEIQVTENQKTYQTPDIILILNETFYDLKQITDLETDVDYLQNIHSMDNVILGDAVVPIVGGGTNNSEYELLCSNSLRLMPGITPFNVLNLSEANSIVSHLHQLNYTTIASHPREAVNYSRATGYRDLGFDMIHFAEDFENGEYYGERWFETDESIYKDLIRWYEENTQVSNPLFMYTLTIQNHGGWDMNPPNYDKVHVTNDYGDYEQQINEFLTGMKMSDEAFYDLTEYFKTVDRDVIVCMVGDHSTRFVEEIADEEYMSDELNLRTTPFVIWANYKLSSEGNMGRISMNYLVPSLLDIANIKLSPYYQYMLDLKTDIPILTVDNTYYDKAGNVYLYEENSEYSARVNQYFYMEYNNLQNKQDRNNQLFEIYD